MNDYVVGNIVTITGTFARLDPDGAETPGTVTCQVKRPDGTYESLTPEAGDVGANSYVYTAEFDTTDEVLADNQAVYHYEFRSESGLIARDHDKFRLVRGPFP